MTYTNRIYCHDSRDLRFIPDGVVSLTVTSPMYLGAGVKYQTVTDMMTVEDYTELHRKVWAECCRVTEPGGRIAVVVANVGRDPYVRLDALHARLLTEEGFVDRGSLIWNKGPVYGTAWGSWRRPTAPQLRDMHEFILVFQKPGKKSSQGFGDMTSPEFCAATQSVWDIRPASARRAVHPAPFPIEIPTRLIRLYTYPDDLILDPFVGSGTTCQAAGLQNRRWIGVDCEQTYCDRAEHNMQAFKAKAETS